MSRPQGSRRQERKTGGALSCTESPDVGCGLSHNPMPPSYLRVLINESEGLKRRYSQSGALTYCAPLCKSVHGGVLA